METIEYRSQDKSQWGDGDWQNEPDKRQWQDPATGYPCLIVRNRMGALCGYVGVSKGHPAYGMAYDGLHAYADRLQARIRKLATQHGDLGKGYAEGRRRTRSAETWKYRKRTKAGKAVQNISVHGGLTFSDHCDDSPDPSKGICHIGEEHVYWFGFDCSHAYDLSPGMNDLFSKERRLVLDRYETYRNVQYVTGQVEALAKQLAAMTAEGRRAA